MSASLKAAEQAARLTKATHAAALKHLRDVRQASVVTKAKAEKIKRLEKAMRECGSHQSIEAYGRVFPRVNITVTNDSFTYPPETVK